MAKFNSLEECELYAEKLSISTLLKEYSELLWKSVQKEEKEKGTAKIVITEEQFNEFFRIKGIAVDGTSERRGRPRKNVD